MNDGSFGHPRLAPSAHCPWRNNQQALKHFVSTTEDLERLQAFREYCGGPENLDGFRYPIINKTVKAFDGFGLREAVRSTLA